MPFEWSYNATFDPFSGKYVSVTTHSSQYYTPSTRQGLGVEVADLALALTMKNFRDSWGPSARIYPLANDGYYISIECEQQGDPYYLVVHGFADADFTNSAHRFLIPKTGNQSNPAGYNPIHMRPCLYLAAPEKLIVFHGNSAFQSYQGLGNPLILSEDPRILPLPKVTPQGLFLEPDENRKWPVRLVMFLFQENLCLVHDSCLGSKEDRWHIHFIPMKLMENDAFHSPLLDSQGQINILTESGRLVQGNIKSLWSGSEFPQEMDFPARDLMKGEKFRACGPPAWCRQGMLFEALFRGGEHGKIILYLLRRPQDNLIAVGEYSPNDRDTRLQYQPICHTTLSQALVSTAEGQQLVMVDLKIPAVIVLPVTSFNNQAINWAPTCFAMPTPSGWLIPGKLEREVFWRLFSIRLKPEGVRILNTVELHEAGDPITPPVCKNPYTACWSFQRQLIIISGQELS